jgi:hypothetical protein
MHTLIPFSCLDEAVDAANTPGTGSCGKPHRAPPSPLWSLSFQALGFVQRCPALLRNLEKPNMASQNMTRSSPALPSHNITGIDELYCSGRGGCRVVIISVVMVHDMH